MWRKQLRSWFLCTLTVVLCVGVVGCSLVSLKSPERPLSPQDLNARFLTREFSHFFSVEVGQSADQIIATDTNPNVQVAALRWKISAVAESERAAMRIIPMMALVDTWALAVQMKEFLSPGHPGGALFGSHQNAALIVATELDGRAEELARKVIAPGDFGKYQHFIQDYTREHPLRDLDFVRTSVVEEWRRTGAELKLADSIGTIPEAMADFSDRMKISTDGLASETLWRTQLALRESGYSANDVRIGLRQLDERLARMSEVATNAPDLVHSAVADVRRSVIDVLDRVDVSSAAMMQGLRTEREALSADVRTEREALVVAADVQRKAIAEDVARIADQVVKSSGEQVRYLAREVLALLVVLAAVVLGLPFAAGYLVGRARRDRV